MSIYYQYRLHLLLLTPWTDSWYKLNPHLVGLSLKPCMFQVPAEICALQERYLG